MTSPAQRAICSIGRRTGPHSRRIGRDRGRACSQIAGGGRCDRWRDGGAGRYPSRPASTSLLRHDKPPRRRFSSASEVRNARIFRYDSCDDGNAGDDGSKIQFSKLTPRQSAELEDELHSRLDGADVDDERLADPILRKSISRKGLDWIRSVSVPSSFAFGGGGDDAVGRGDDSITVTIRPPTLLHPKLDEVASNVASVVQEEVVSLIRKRSEWFAKGGAKRSELRPEDVSVTAKISPRETTTPSQSSSNDDPSDLGKALQNVTHFLAVYSCKGGVGKSTIAANLAYQLSSLGGRVGLVDLDVYGPSLPLLVRPDDPSVRPSPIELGKNMVEPIVHGGVKLMSLGYVSPSSGVPGSGPGGGAAVLRGPMAGRVVAQLLRGTNWGDLDVLVLDLPPGTGDVQLEVCQSLSLSGAVAVSTPSALAWADARKGVQMFGEMGVPTLALVENMAYFVCEGGGRHYPFGKAGDEAGDDDSSSTMGGRFLPGPSRVFQLPISTTVNDANDAGAPLCCDPPAGAEEELEAFSKLADAISTDLLLLQHGGSPPSVRGSASGGDGDANNVTSVVVDGAGESEFDVPFTQLSVDNANKKITVRLFSGEGGYQKTISGGDLRRRNPRTGEEEDATAAGRRSEDAPRSHGSGGGGGGGMVHHHPAAGSGPDPAGRDGLFPARATRKGNYGYEVEWADGTKTIYSLLAISRAAGGRPPGEHR